MRRTSLRPAVSNKPHVLFVDQEKDEYDYTRFVEDLPPSRPAGRRIQDRPLTLKPHALFTDQERDDCFLDDPLPARPIGRPPQGQSFAAKFNSRWSARENSSKKVAAPVEEERFEDVDIPVVEPPIIKRPELSGQTPESVLRDIEIMVGRVREICGKPTDGRTQ
jgi:hypothetical protein